VGWEVDRYLKGVTVRSTGEEILAVAPDQPVLRIAVRS
jgi:hypothetical protein